MGIFEPFRAIGYITSSVPFSVQRLGTETFVTVSVGKAWQIYNAHITGCGDFIKVLAVVLTIILLKPGQFFGFQRGPQLAKKIRALASYRDYTFAAYGNDIGVFKRAHQVATWSRHNAKVNLLLLFGEHILSVDVEGNVFIWAFKGADENLSPVGHILLDSEFTPSCIMHPDTYLNKVILGGQDGSLQLWNISTKKKLYEFKGWKSSISCCVSSPALDVIAVGCADGKIHVHNVRYDEEVVTFSQSTRGAVTALSFRTASKSIRAWLYLAFHDLFVDFFPIYHSNMELRVNVVDEGMEDAHKDGQPLLASGGSSGVISIWNLEKRRLQSVIRDAHDSSVISLHFFANEPVLMSTSADNSIKMWIFDTSDGDPRLLRFRSGHSAPPLCIRYSSHSTTDGDVISFNSLLSADDQQSRELSQRHVTKRAKKLKLKNLEVYNGLAHLVEFRYCANEEAEIRERDWSNVVTCHMDTAHAYVWRLQNFVLGEHILTPSADVQTPVKACTISSCGNFAILGTAGGWIEKFNLQSGMSRGSYVDMSEKRSSAHDREVVGVACDSTNSLMISAGYNGDIKVWSFKGRDLKARWEIGCTVVKIIYHRSNGLLATVTDDLIIRMFDVVALKMVRKFEGHTDRITDICFSEDGKWLLSSSMDGTLRIWDIILARQIDAIHVDVSITALSLSPNMDVLATTHVDQNGVYLWVNQTMFSGAPHNDSYGSGKEVVNVKLPPISSGEGSKDDDDSDKPALSNSQPQATTNTLVSEQQIPDLVTLSLLPKSQWQSLINLDIIKARNKPIEPPKKPEKAPFFLPSIPSLSGEILFKVSEPNNEGKETQADEFDKHARSTDLPSSPFVQFLQSSVETENFEAFTDYLKGLSPSTLDIHGETIRRQSKLQAKAQKLLEAQSGVWQKLDGLFQSARCMVTFLSNSQF
ncbi:Quinonprotein alcohol dehydrogenase-like-superfamily [Cynara cardunculus var. scolymus]|uniref:Quinonprotein alcohol dehydrogenase-like-superfamily n=1 Tax=Cynara cardunculus var. scolymus TaxID=59895 RepID=A0A103Y1B5_CYNCS|nr:Quinonprotein alcohol dehydrogenase-like-superfamily [Cynara cardunculus var. scolymus]